MTRFAVRSLFAATLAGALVACARSAAANCGAEACPLDPQGANAVHGRLGFDLAYQHTDQDRPWLGSSAAAGIDAGASVWERRTLTEAWLGTARARLTPRLSVTASLPYIRREHDHAVRETPGVFVPSRWQFEGVGDAIVMATVLAWRPLPTGALSLEAGVKLPTGRREVPGVNGEQPEPPVRPGTGSTDGLVGVQYRQSIEAPTLSRGRAAVPLTVAASYRANGTGTEGYRVGDELQARVAATYPAFRSLQLLGQVDLAVRGRDDVGSTDAIAQETGSTALLASPGFRLVLPSGFASYALFEFALYRHTHGEQLVSPMRVLVGTAWSLPR